LESAGAVLLPCPALFSSPTSRVRNPGRLKIALSTQPETSLQPPSSEGVYQFTEELFRELAKTDHQCEVVCHYVDELTPLARLGLPVRYSYDARDYLGIYDEFDLVVTTRVHGAGIAASLGVPALVVKHSARTSTADGFLSQYIDPQWESVASVLARIDALDVSALSRELVEHKARAREDYLQLLTSRCPLPGPWGRGPDRERVESARCWQPSHSPFSHSKPV
jgi:hypothetical protein